MAPKDPKQAAASGSGGGFFATIASGLSNFGSAMSKSVNGYGSFGASDLKVVNFICFAVAFL